MPDEQERWARVKDVVGLALETDPHERPSLIARLCAGDAALQKEVEALLDCSGETAGLDRCLADAVSRTIADYSAAPSQIGPYRIERLLGSGGMGSVYLGIRFDDQLPARVAIKVTQFGGETLLERFRHERRILAGLIHPYIARLLDAGMLEDGRPYFVMEYVDGRPIDRYVEEFKPPVLELFLKICAAVQFAHQNMVIHRDLKAGNILVTNNGDPRLLDFGIAKLIDGDSDIQQQRTLPSDCMLTPAAASPEQASGAAVTMASDVYSLGVLLYRLLTGASPYAGAKDFAADPGRVIREYEPPPASAVPDLDPRSRRLLRGDLDNILRKALEKDPARRYPTAHELAADIERHMAAQPIEARPASFRYRAGKFVRRNRLAVTAAGLLTLSIAVGLVASLQYAHRANQQQLRAEREFAALRKLTHSFLFEIDDAIQSLSGATALHELVVKRSIEYLDQLATEAGNDAAVLDDLAEGYTRIARLLANERHARPSGSLETGMQTGLKALAIRRRLAAFKPGDPATLRNLQDSLWSVAGAYATMGDYRAALGLQWERVQSAQRIASRQTTSEDSSRQADSLTAMADYEWRLGRYDEALDHARHSLAIREDLLRASPAGWVRRKVAISHEFIGYVLTQQENFHAAADEHRAALNFAEAALRENPQNADLQRLLAVTSENLCESLARDRRSREALPYCHSALSIYTNMNQADPNNVQSREDLASGESTLSLALERAHSSQQALSWQNRARSLIQEALSQDPGSIDLAELNAKSLMELTVIEEQLHNTVAARTAASQAQNVLQDLARHFPQSHLFAVLLDQSGAAYRSLK
ncbi:MAG TPA: serine/threonine-protein kinase [Bryobacteraceae bacterium]|nr:serine/threonine-protein kinase [Bryobacteraceae bacterium]